MEQGAEGKHALVTLPKASPPAREAALLRKTPKDSFSNHVMVGDHSVIAMNRFACLLLAPLLAASTPVTFTVEHLDSVSRAPADDIVHVYYNPSDVKQPFQAIGLITVNYEKGANGICLTRRN
jgi:hypothetical protein